MFSGSPTGPIAQRPLGLIATSIVWIGSTGIAFAECDHFARFGFPVHRSPEQDTGMSSPPSWTVIFHAGQVVAFNPAHNVSDWVAYQLRRDRLLDPKVERDGNGRGDPAISKAHRVVHSDYYKTGYERGHLAPAAAMRWSEEAMYESFYMSNMAPQVGGFNRGSWKEIEHKMRRWACDRGELHVVTGPLYESENIKQLVVDKNGDGEDDNGILVDVPSHFFKFALDPRRMEAIAFVVRNETAEQYELADYLTSIDSIEDRTQFDFLWEIADDMEEAIEQRVQPTLWADPTDEECARLN